MTTPTHSLDLVEYRLDDLQPYHRNPRRGDTAVIAESLRRNGQYRPIVVNIGTHTGRPAEILAGNHTYQAARSLGWETIRATTIDVDDDAAARIVLADNRTSDLAGMDEEQLLALLQDLDDVTGTGYTETDLARLIPDTETTTADPTDTPADPVTRPGDIWQLGPHRVMCGDATNPATLATLFGDDRADCMWTDPPYGVSYVGKTKDALTIQNDGADDIDQLLNAAWRAALTVLQPGAPVYVAGPPGPLSLVFQTRFAEHFDYRQNLVWVKNTLVLGRSDYHYRHEPILYGFAPGGEGRLGRGGPRWYGDDSQTTVFREQTSVFEVDKPPASREHPTMKPVELIRAMLRNSAKRDDIVFDPFGGSGSTLLAAHTIGAHARLTELDPRYVDVICRRWQDTTGEHPINAATGEPHDFHTI